MKKTIHHIIIALFLLSGGSIFFSSCESVLFIELEEGVKLIVLNGTLTPDENVAVQVSRTRHILDNAELAPLEDATVRLLEDGQALETLEYDDQGYYVSGDFVPVAGRQYAIEVEQPGYEPVRAECSIPQPVAILGIDTLTSEEQMNDPYGYYWSNDSRLQFDLSLEDPPGEDNYYMLSVWADRAVTEYRGDTTYLLADSVLVDGHWIWWVRDTTYALYEVNRHAGYASFYSDDLILECRSNTGVVFSDQLIDGQQYSFRGSIPVREITSADSTNLEFRLSAISEDYYRYLKTRYMHFTSRDDALAVPVIVYSNVIDGTGILGGFSTDKQAITTFVPEDDWGYYYYYE